MDISWEIEVTTNLKQTHRQELADFRRPAPFDETVNKAHTMSVEKSQVALQYESLYDVRIRPHSLRLELRDIQFCLEDIGAANIPATKMTTLEHRSKVVDTTWKQVPRFVQSRKTCSRLLVVLLRISARSRRTRHEFLRIC